MNLYILVEGLTEFKVYPAWIEHLTRSKLTRCHAFDKVTNQNYYIFEGGGAGKMLRSSIPNAMKDIQAHPVYDYFLVIIDSEDESVVNRVAKVEHVIKSGVTLPSNCNVKILIQRVCLETWLCGHTDHYLSAKSSTNSNVLKFVNDYDMENTDPELMLANPGGRPEFSHFTIGQYHSCYLHHMLLGAKLVPKYSKGIADRLIDVNYLDRLIQRKNIETPSHLGTFNEMLTFFQTLL